MPSGPILVATGAALFACTNAVSTAFYRRGGTVITVYVLRCIVVYAANGIMSALTEGNSAAVRVISLNSGQRDSSVLAFFWGLLGSAQSLGLNVSLVYTTFADAFTIFKGVDSLSTVLIARACLDSGERLSLRELACGVMTLGGVVLIAQPALLFGASAVHINVYALAVATLAGSLSAGFSVLTRLLSRMGGSHAAHLSPAMLLSHKLAVMFAFFVAVWFLGRITGLSELDGFGWIQFHWPATLEDWTLLGLHCALTLGAQLSLAAGYATTRAGIGGFLQLTELAWVYLIDVTLLAEPTNLYATLGTALVFSSALAVLQVSSAAAASAKTADGSIAPTTAVGSSSSAGLREGLLSSQKKG